MQRMGKTNASEGLNVVAEMKLVGGDRVVLGGGQEPFQGMFEVNATGGASRMLREMVLNRGEVLRGAGAIGIKTRDDPRFESDGFGQPSRGFVHSDLPCQTDSSVFPGEIGMIQDVEGQRERRLFPHP